MTVPTNELFSTSITLPSIQPGRLVRSGDIFTVSPFFILQFGVCLRLQKYEYFPHTAKNIFHWGSMHVVSNRKAHVVLSKSCPCCQCCRKTIAVKEKREARACASLEDCRCCPLRFTRPWGLRPRRRGRRPLGLRRRGLRQRERRRPSWRGSGGWSWLSWPWARGACSRCSRRAR